jgi:hypothetical protein
MILQKKANIKIRPYSGTVSRDVMTRTVRAIETLFSRDEAKRRLIRIA